MLLAVLASNAAARGESRTQTISLAERALAGGWLLESVFLHVHAASALILSGRYAQSIVVCDDFIAHARAHGDLPGLAMAHAFRASGHWHAGSLDEALAESELATRLAPPDVAAVASSFALTFRIESLVLRGRARAGADDSALGNGAGGPASQRSPAQRAGQAAAGGGQDGRGTRGHACCRAASRSMAGPELGLLTLARGGGDRAASMGDPIGAQELIDDELQQRRRWGDPWLLGQAMRAQALSGRRAAGPILGDAVEVLRPSEARLELARTLAELGIAEAEAGRHASPASTCARPPRSPKTAPLPPSLSAPARRSSRRADGHGARPRPDPSRSRRPSTGSPAWPRKARPTGASRSRCSSPRRPSRPTSPTPTASSASGCGGSSPPL